MNGRSRSIHHSAKHDVTAVVLSSGHIWKGAEYLTRSSAANSGTGTSPTQAGYSFGSSSQEPTRTSEQAHRCRSSKRTDLLREWLRNADEMISDQ